MNGAIQMTSPAWTGYLFTEKTINEKKNHQCKVTAFNDMN